MLWIDEAHIKLQSPECTAAAAAAKSRQLFPTLCDPIDGSPPGSSVPGILQARILEWVAISFSNAWKWKVKVKSLSRVRLLSTPWTAAPQAPPSMGFSRQEYWSGVPLPSPTIRAIVYKTDIWCHCVRNATWITSVFISLGRYIPKYFILFLVMVNGIVALISLFSHC